MAAAASNRFAPLSSPRSSPAASRSNSLSRSDASQRSRSASRPPSNTSASSRNLARRLENYPSTWTYTDLPPQQLAICGFSYSTKSEKDTCFCHICDKVMSVQWMVTLGEWSNDDLLDFYEDCLLADTIFDMINNVPEIYTPNSHPRSRTLEILSPPSPPPSTSPLQERPSEYAAATPPPLTSTDTPTQPSPSSPRLVSPVRPLYAAVASRPYLTLPPPSKPRQSLASTPPAPTTTLRTSRASPLAPATTPSRRRSPHTSSPVLSIHDLERRFQNKSSPLYNQHLYHSTRNPPNTSLTRFLHAIADLIGSYNTSYIIKHDHYPPMWD